MVLPGPQKNLITMNSDYLESSLIQAVETDIQVISGRVAELAGIKESDTGLAAPACWDLAADKQSMQSEQPLQV